jgi:hypothetical protein
MGLFDLMNHLINFAAPAVFVGVFTAVVAPWVMPRTTRRRALLVPALVNSGVGLCVLVAGLWFFGNDGKMASYVALVLATAVSQLALMQLPRR